MPLGFRRRRMFRKKFFRRRKRFPRRRGFKRTRFARSVMRVIRPEVKVRQGSFAVAINSALWNGTEIIAAGQAFRYGIQTNAGGNQYQIFSQTSWPCLENIRQGTGVDQRIGQKIRLKAIQHKFQLFMAKGTAISQTNWALGVRYQVWLWKYPKEVANYQDLQWNNIMVPPSSSNYIRTAYIDPDKRKGLIVLKDKYKLWKPVILPGGGSGEVTFNFKKAFGTEGLGIKYNGDAGTSIDLVNWALIVTFTIQYLNEYLTIPTSDMYIGSVSRLWFTDV